MDDIRFMAEALEEARLALEEGEVPVGCVIVKDGQIIARAHNRVEALGDPTAHAEILAIREAARVLGDWRLEGCRVYVTSEPCVMCSGALVLARVEEVVYALPEPKFGGAESLFAIPDDPRLNHRVRVRRGPLAEEVKALLAEFFAKRRH